MANDLTSISEGSLLRAVLQLAESLNIPVCTDDYDLVLAVMIARRTAIARATARTLRLVECECPSN